MANLDLLINASVAGEASRIVDSARWSVIARPSHAVPACLTGCPAISVCAGPGMGGLPVAMQIIAKPFAEPSLFRAAYAYQLAHGWHTQRPAITQ
jgi:aspartyl-tRNA(Asn)/glutamyl-tRNA(Gln) amidotransferase subunit A